MFEKQIKEERNGKKGKRKEGEIEEYGTRKEESCLKQN